MDKRNRRSTRRGAGLAFAVLLAAIGGIAGPAAAREGLVNDGSFEASACGIPDSPWSCTSSNFCNWIADLVPLGLWNYDGQHVAWLGGQCSGQPTDYTRICQELLIDEELLVFQLMQQGASIDQILTLTVDGVEVWRFIPPDWEPPLAYQRMEAYVDDFLGGVHRVCFDYERTVPQGANFWVDYVELEHALVPAQALSLSAVKSRY